MPNQTYDENIRYLKQHYKTLDEIAAEANISTDTIEDFIAQGLVPKHSYEITTQHNFTSCVAVNTFSTITHYFHPDVIQWIVNVNELVTAGSNVKKIIYSAFESELTLALQMQEAKIAYPDYVDATDKFNLAKLPRLIEEKWLEFLDGGYGVCLQHLSATNIVKKDAAVAILNGILNGSKMHYPTDDIKYYLAMYNELVQPFAPYELNKSSRQKAIDITLSLAN